MQLRILAVQLRIPAVHLLRDVVHGRFKSKASCKQQNSGKPRPPHTPFNVSRIFADGCLFRFRVFKRPSWCSAICSDCWDQYPRNIEGACGGSVAFLFVSILAHVTSQIHCVLGKCEALSVQRCFQNLSNDFCRQLKPPARRTSNPSTGAVARSASSGRGRCIRKLKKRRRSTIEAAVQLLLTAVKA